MKSGFYMKDGETFSEAWQRCWHEGVLGDRAYGHFCVIARMRRGKRVVIPAEWRGKVPHNQTMSKRHSKSTRKVRNQRNDILNPRVRQEAMAPQLDDWGLTTPYIDNRMGA